MVVDLLPSLGDATVDPGGVWALMEAQILAIAQVVVVVLLTADKWVHKVTGKASHETRIGALEKTIAGIKRETNDGNARLSRTFSNLQQRLLQIEVLQGRQEEHFESTDQRVDRLERRADHR